MQLASKFPIRENPTDYHNPEEELRTLRQDTFGAIPVVEKKTSILDYKLDERTPERSKPLD